MNGNINYKIDLSTHTLHKKVPNQKMRMLKNVKAAGEHYLNDTEVFMLRMDIASYVGKGGQNLDEANMMMI